MDPTRKKSIKKKLEDFFRSRRPTRKDLVQRNILPSDEVLPVDQKRRKPLLTRLVSKRDHKDTIVNDSAQQNKSPPQTGAKSTNNVRLAQDNKRSQSVSDVKTSPPNSLRGKPLPLSVSSPAVVYDRTSCLQAEEADFKLPVSPRPESSTSQRGSTSPRFATMNGGMNYPTTLTTAKSASFAKPTPVSFPTTKSSSFSKSTSARSATCVVVSTPRDAAFVSPSSPPNRSLHMTPNRSPTIDPSSKFSTMPAMKLSPPPSPSARLKSTSDEQTTILREQCKQSSDIFIRSSEMVFLKTPVRSSPLECPTPFFDELMGQMETEM